MSFFYSSNMNENLKLLWESITNMQNGLETKLDMFKKFLKSPSKVEYIMQGLKSIEKHSAKGNISMSIS